MSLIRRRMAPRSTHQTGSQRRLGGNARSFLSRYIVVSLVIASISNSLIAAVVSGCEVFRITKPRKRFFLFANLSMTVCALTGISR